MAKIVLAFPRIDQEKEHHHLPVSTLSLAAPLETEGYDYAIWDERVDPVSEFDDYMKDAEVLGITMFTGYQTHCGYDIIKKSENSQP